MKLINIIQKINIFSNADRSQSVNWGEYFGLSCKTQKKGFNAQTTLKPLFY
jgi:hypothetical protein